MKIGVKLRCYPDDQTKQLIHQTVGNNRFLYNYFLDLRSKNYKQNKELNLNNKANTINTTHINAKYLSSNDCIKLIPVLKTTIFKHYFPDEPLRTFSRLIVQNSTKNANNVLIEDKFLEFGYTSGLFDGSGNVHLDSVKKYYDRLCEEINKYKNEKRTFVGIYEHLGINIEYIPKKTLTNKI